MCISNTTINQVPSNKERLNLPSTKVCGVDVHATCITPNFAVANLKMNGHMLGQLLAAKNLAAAYRDC